MLKPALVDVDKRLFADTPVEIKALAQKARAELRQKARQQFARSNGLPTRSR